MDLDFSGRWENGRGWPQKPKLQVGVQPCKEAPPATKSAFNELRNRNGDIFTHATGIRFADKVFPTSLCAYAPATDSCQGDSGGPFFTYNGTKFTVVGVGVWVVRSLISQGFILARLCTIENVQSIGHWVLRGDCHVFVPILQKLTQD
jgi:hypothetical protein